MLDRHPNQLADLACAASRLSWSDEAALVDHGRWTVSDYGHVVGNDGSNSDGADRGFAFLGLGP